LERGFSREPLVDPLDADAEYAEYHYDRAAKHGHLLLAKTHGGR